MQRKLFLLSGVAFVALVTRRPSSGSAAALRGATRRARSSPRSTATMPCARGSARSFSRWQGCSWSCSASASRSRRRLELAIRPPRRHGSRLRRRDPDRVRPLRACERWRREHLARRPAGAELARRQHVGVLQHGVRRDAARRGGRDPLGCGVAVARLECARPRDRDLHPVRRLLRTPRDAALDRRRERRALTLRGCAGDRRRARERRNTSAIQGREEHETHHLPSRRRRRRGRGRNRGARDHERAARRQPASLRRGARRRLRDARVLPAVLYRHARDPANPRHRGALPAERRRHGGLGQLRLGLPARRFAH